MLFMVLRTKITRRNKTVVPKRVRRFLHVGPGREIFWRKTRWGILVFSRSARKLKERTVQTRLGGEEELKSSSNP